MSVRLSVIEQRMRENRKAGGNHRVLFLDFDGVVNVPYQYGTPEYEDAMSRGVYDFFRPEITERLNKLIHDYQLSVVISSSWRTMGVKFCQNSLLEAGFDPDVIIEDLPGIYSLSPYTLEEVVSRNYLIDEKPDAILNIVDGTNLERNLYLTTQLAETGIPMIMAVNMMDLVAKRGDVIDFDRIGADLGCKVVKISALKGDGTMEAAEAAIAAVVIIITAASIAVIVFLTLFVFFILIAPFRF